MKKVGLVSLGCAKNLVDSENILGFLDHFGYQITSNPEEADIIFVNTCGFIESAKRESIKNIFDMVAYDKKVVITGCLAQRYYDDLKSQIPEVAGIIPIRDYHRFGELLSLVDKDFNNKDGLNDMYRYVTTGPFSAYLKIGEGCDNRCSYCAIPLIRGGYVSKDIDSIINEAKDLVSSGIKELVVLQQDTTKYGYDFKDKNIDIVTLLKELLKIENVDYIRLLYLYPDEISDSLIDLISKEPRLTPYFDIPIQHSEDHILKDMNRRGDKNYLKALFTKIRNKIPNAILRTTIMVGFPGETSDDFNNLLDFVNEIKFDHLGCFMYSKEEGTPSFKYKNQVPSKIKKERLDILMKAQQRISYLKNKTHIGEVMEGLVCGTDHDYYLLRSYYNAPDEVDGKILFKSDTPLKLGDKVKVRITEVFVYDLMGEIVK